MDIQNRHGIQKTQDTTCTAKWGSTAKTTTEATKNTQEDKTTASETPPKATCAYGGRGFTTKA